MLISVQLDVDYFRDALLACTKRRTQHISYLYVQTIFMFKIEGLMKQMDFFLSVAAPCWVTYTDKCIAFSSDFTTTEY